MKWKIRGHDTFEDEPYPLEGEFDDQVLAEAAAAARLVHLRETQPSEESGGQDPGGIQDHVYVVRPDGTEYRYFGD